MAFLGIDVSNGGQGNIDAATAAPYINFGICKATEGLSFTDPSFVNNRDGIKTAKRIPGAYHFLRSTSNGAAQCDNWMSVIGGPDGQILCLDVEPTGTDTNSGSQVTSFLQEFVKLAPGRKLAIYSNRGLWADVNGPSDVSSFPVVGWHAGVVNGAYTTAQGSLAAQWGAAVSSVQPSTFGGITDFPLIQFTDHATVPGVSSPCDGNAWLGSYTDLLTLAGFNVTTSQEISTMALVQHGPDILLVDGGKVAHVPNMPVANELAGWTGQNLSKLPAASQGVLDWYAASFSNPPVTLSAASVDALATALAAKLPATPGVPTAADIAKAVNDETERRLAN